MAIYVSISALFCYYLQLHPQCSSTPNITHHLRFIVNLWWHISCYRHSLPKSFDLNEVWLQQNSFIKNSNEFNFIMLSRKALSVLFQTCKLRISNGPLCTIFQCYRILKLFKMHNTYFQTIVLKKMWALKSFFYSLYSYIIAIQKWFEEHLSKKRFSIKQNCNNQ